MHNPPHGACTGTAPRLRSLYSMHCHPTATGRTARLPDSRSLLRRPPGDVPPVLGASNSRQRHQCLHASPGTHSSRSRELAPRYTRFSQYVAHRRVARSPLLGLNSRRSSSPRPAARKPATHQRRQFVSHQRPVRPCRSPLGARFSHRPVSAACRIPMFTFSTSESRKYWATHAVDADVHLAGGRCRVQLALVDRVHLHARAARRA